MKKKEEEIKETKTERRKRRLGSEGTMGLLAALLYSA